MYGRNVQIPLYLNNVRLSIIDGMEGNTIDWANYLEAMDKLVKEHVKFNPCFDNKGTSHTIFHIVLYVVQLENSP